MLNINIYHEEKMVHMLLDSSTTIAVLKEKLHSRVNIEPKDQLLIGMSSLEDTEPISKAACTYDFLISKQDSFDSYADLLSTFQFNLGLYRDTGIFFNIYKYETLLKTSLLNHKLLFLCLNGKEKNEFFTCFKDFFVRVDDFFIDSPEDLICWDTSNVKFHSCLKNILLETLPNKEGIINYVIDNQLPAVFILTPSETMNYFYTCIQGTKLNLINFFQHFKAAKEVFDNDRKLFNKLKEPAVRFQQDMMLKLGNRDYDCLEGNEKEYLKSKIAYAFYGPPQLLEGCNDNQKKFIDKAITQILKHNNKYCKWTNKVYLRVIFNVLEPLSKDSSNGVLVLPIFVIRKCKHADDPCKIYIDHTLRVYKSLKHYIENVQLHKCIMVLPKGAKYQQGANGLVDLNRYYSPKCKLGSKIITAVDIGTSVLGLASTGVMGAALIPAITVAPIALGIAAAGGIGIGIYSLIRSSFNVVDKVIHDDDLSLKNSESRTAYLNITAGILGFATMGATSGLSYLAAKGTVIPTAGKYFVNGISISNIAVNAVSIGSATYDLLDYRNNDRKPSALTMLQLASSVLFFSNSLYSFKSANVIINEAHGTAINGLSTNLQSKNQKKMLNKLLKETIRQKGNQQIGTAEVISTLRKKNDLSEVMAALKRSNKLFNKHNIRFSAEGGTIKLNGCSVDLQSFSELSSNQKVQYLLELPTIPESAPKNTNSNFTLDLKLLKTFENVNINVKSTQQYFDSLFNMLGNEAKRKIYFILSNVLDSLLKDFKGIFDYLKEIHSNTEPVIDILDTIKEYFKGEMNRQYMEYEKQKENRRQGLVNEIEFDEKSIDYLSKIEKALYFYERAVTVFKWSTNKDKIIEYVLTKIADKAVHYGTNLLKKENRGRLLTSKTKCNICQGYYYSA